MTIKEIIEIVTLILGVIYLLLELGQKNAMWVVGIFSSLAAMYLFASEHLWASFLLNSYYFFMSFWGIYQWRKDRKILVQDNDVLGQDNEMKNDNRQSIHDIEKLENDKITEKGVVEIHLNKLPLKVIIQSLFFLIIGTLGLSYLMIHFENPQSYLDSFIAILSMIATWWLAKAYLQQWLLWIVADSSLAFLCLIQGMPWLALLYFFYAVGAAYGFYLWRKKGVYLQEIS